MLHDNSLLNKLLRSQTGNRRVKVSLRAAKFSLKNDDSIIDHDICFLLALQIRHLRTVGWVAHRNEQKRFFVFGAVQYFLQKIHRAWSVRQRDQTRVVHRRQQQPASQPHRFIDVIALLPLAIDYVVRFFENHNQIRRNF